MKNKLLRRLRSGFKILSRIKIEYPYAQISVGVSCERINYDYSLDTFHPANLYFHFKDVNDLMRIIKNAERCYILSEMEKIRSKRESKRIKKLLKNQLCQTKKK